MRIGVSLEIVVRLFFFAQICTFEQFWASIYNETRNGGAVYERANISHISG